MRASPNELTSARRLCRSYTRRTRRHVAHGQERRRPEFGWERRRAATDRCYGPVTRRAQTSALLRARPLEAAWAAKSRSTVLSSTFNCVCPRRHRHRDRTRAAALVVTNCGGYIGAGRSPQDPCRPTPPIGSRMRAGLTSPAARLGAPRTYYDPRRRARRNRARGAPAGSWLRATGPRCMSTRQLTASVLRQKPPARSWLVEVVP